MLKFVNSNHDSNYYLDIKKVISSRKKEVFSFFESEDLDLECNVYIYDSIENLAEGLKERGFLNHPDYMCACFKDEDNSLNFFEPGDAPSFHEWSKEEYENVIFHEMIHAIVYKLFGNIPEWLNEGIAKYLDGTYSKGIKWLLNNYINNNPVPEQREIFDEFGFHEYDSYDYAYLMVSYLIDILGKSEFIKYIKSGEYKNISSDLLDSAIDYYNNKYDLISLRK